MLGYFGKHWKGELSPSKALFGGLAIFILANAISISILIYSGQSGLAMLIFLALSWISLMWWIVGAAKSVGAKSTGKIIFTTLAVIGALSVLIRQLGGY